MIPAGNARMAHANGAACHIASSQRLRNSPQQGSACPLSRMIGNTFTTCRSALPYMVSAAALRSSDEPAQPAPPYFISWRYRGNDMQRRLDRRHVEIIQAGVPGGISGWRGEPIAAVAVGALDGERPKPPSPRFPVWKPRYLDGGVFLLITTMRGHLPEGELDMPTLREDALRGAALGILISLGVVLLLSGVVYWL